MQSLVSLLDSYSMNKEFISKSILLCRSDNIEEFRERLRNTKDVFLVYMAEQ